MTSREQAKRDGGQGEISTVGMSHKAYAFDWWSFELDLHPLLHLALVTNDTTELEAFIDAHREQLTDPYEGNPLPEDWQAALGNRDVHELGDYALTHYYTPASDNGVGGAWFELSDQLPELALNSLLGFSVGPREHLFDPGRYGSYFQTPSQVRQSLSVLRPLGIPELTWFVELLERCTAEGRGVYVTF